MVSFIDTVLIKTTSYLVDESSLKFIITILPLYLQKFKQICDIFDVFNFVISKGGVYSNDHLNICHPMHGGGGALT